MPQRTAADNRVRRGARTIMEAGVTPDSMVEAFEKKVSEGLFSYTPKKLKELVATARATIEAKGFEGALAQWQDIVDGLRKNTPEDMALAEMLYSAAADAGDAELAMRLAAEIAAEGTRAGQSSNAIRLLKRLSPEGQLYYAQQSVKNLQQELTKRFGDKAPDLRIDEGLVQEFLSAKDDAGRKSAMDRILQNVADQVPATWYDKWNAWRYLAMLGNLRTHFRNFWGNAVFVPAIKLKNAYKTGIEASVDAISKRRGKGGLQEKTAAILTAKDRDLIDFAKADYEQMADAITGTGKKNPASVIMDNRTVFNTKWLEAFRKFNNMALEREDALFLKRAYADSMAQYLKANGLTVDFLNSGTEGAKTHLERARTYAIEQAQRATYRDASAVASAINKWKRTNAGTAILGEGLLPFTKTPINILKRGVEYSPVGLMNGIKEAVWDVRRGNKTASQAIEDISAGLSGSSIMVLGAFMASLGLLTGPGDENDDKRGFEEMLGRQDYALQIGDHSYTIDWAAPSSIPLFIGSAIYELSREEGELTLSTVVDGISKLSEPMVEMSMLQGVENAIQSAGYGKEPLTEILTSTISGYFGQGVPTAMGQVARAIDPVRRRTYTTSGDGIPSFVSKPVQQWMNKIPGASMLNQPYVDQWGRVQENTGGSFLGRLAYNMLSPGYYSADETTPVDEEVLRLYEQTGDASVFPGYASKSFVYQGETHYLDGDEYTKFAQTKGQVAYDTIQKMLDDARYQKMEDDKCAELMGQVYGYATYAAKKEVLPSYSNKTYDKAYQAVQNGITASDYYLTKAMMDADGNDRVTQEEAKQALDRSGLSRQEKALMWDLQNSSWRSNPYR